MSETLTFYQYVDQPNVPIQGQDFYAPVSVIGQPIYGRVLFRSHGTVISDCVFDARAHNHQFNLTITGLLDCLIEHCSFADAHTAIRVAI